MLEEVRLIENFVSWQGEGPCSGQSMIILRFKTCNLNCPFCDTKVKMRISAEAPYQLTSIQNQINETKAGILITGGEPTVDRHYDETLTLLNNLEYPVANVETNGYKLLQLFDDVERHKPVMYIYSPKIFDEKDFIIASNILDRIGFKSNIHIKIVYEDRPLVEEFLGLIYKDHSKMMLEKRVWLMPEGTSREQLIINSQKVFDICEKYGLNFSSRDHIIYGFI